MGLKDKALTSGKLDHDEIICPFHGARFSLITGRLYQH
ncbi:Rieske (2Fe-2S) protein [Methylotenera sp.]